jgi:hypothetical protein
MAKYTLRADGVTETIQAHTIEDARAAAHAWARQGDYDADDTCWADTLILDENGDTIETVTTQFDPREPRCVERGQEHDWQSPIELVGGIKENPGVWGNGGGIVSKEVCMLCGCERKTDTWGQRRDTGEQGLTIVSYEPGKHADEVAEMRNSTRYTYSIYDVNPATGGRAWSSHDDVEIEADDAGEALLEAYAEARCVAEPGDRVWVYVWDKDGTVAESGSITIEDE